MRRYAWMTAAMVMAVAVAACGHWPFGASRSTLVDAELQQVAACEQVGALSETLDSGKIITPLARREMIERLETRARGLGGTHLVWVYRTDQTAAARVFRCGD